jgi:hypothetical protein
VPPDADALLVEIAGAPVAAAWIDPIGPPTAPGAPIIRVTPDPPLPDHRAAVAALIARRAGDGPARIAWDAMDAHGLRALSDLGFRPTGDMPYFELGPGAVEYVTGYRDPTGSKVDLVRA